MKTCFTCGHVFDSDTTCAVEEYDQYVGRTGRHEGYCWGGRFPRDEDIELPKVDAKAAQARGAFKHHQLRIHLREDDDD